MLTYTFENNNCPLYEQLYTHIKEDIKCGNLKAGEQLPSKRHFAKNLGISTITVENAYDQLISEGYVYARARKGYYVANITDIPRSIPAKSAKDIRMPQDTPEIIYNLSDNRTSPENFPFSVWAKLMKMTISQRNEELMISSPCGGIYMLREAIAEYLRSFRAMEVDPECIIVGAGTEYLYGMLIRLFGKNKIYCVENPSYTKIYQIYKSNEVTCRYADIDEKGITIQGLRLADAQIAHISPTHHFPTGITMPIDRRYELLAWANEKEGRYIIEDDYDSEFRLTGKPIPPLQSIDINEKVIYMNTFSKTLAPTIRISYMILPAHLADRFYENLSFYSCTVSNFEQYTLAQFIKLGYFEKHINRMRLYYSRQRSKVLACIKQSSLKDKCEIIENDSGLHFLLRLHTNIRHDMLCKLLSDLHIHLESLAKYYHNPASLTKNLFILNYSNLKLEDFQAALELIATALILRR